MTRHDSALVLLGGAPQDPDAFTLRFDEREAFIRYMEATGAKHIDWEQEFIVPPADVRHLWTQAGSPSLIPPVPLWPRVAALAALVLRLRRLVRSGIAYRHVYRPEPYNKIVGGAPGSDHSEACAADLVFNGDAARLIALRELRQIWATGLLGLSIGTVGAGHESRRMHLGVWAPRTAKTGQRKWVYGAGESIW